jgi:hypothetical protein
LVIVISLVSLAHLAVLRLQARAERRHHVAALGLTIVMSVKRAVHVRFALVDRNDALSERSYEHTPDAR